MPCPHHSRSLQRRLLPSQEFVPLAVEVIQMMRLKASITDVEEYEMDELRLAAEYNAPAEEALKSAISSMVAADGTLTRNQLKQVGCVAGGDQGCSGR